MGFLIRTRQAESLEVTFDWDIATTGLSPPVKDVGIKIHEEDTSVIMQLALI